jgi:hypothetical protein
LNNKINLSIHHETRRQVENEKVQREIFTLYNKSDILDLNVAKVYSIVEYNRTLKIYSGCNGGGWPASKEILVSDIVILRKREAYSQRRDLILCLNGSAQTIFGGEESGIERNRNKKLEIKLRHPKSREHEYNPFMIFFPFPLIIDTILG